MTERVLVLPRAEVPNGCDFVGMRRVHPSSLGALRTALARHGRYLDRTLAEDDQSFKQIIPYVVVADAERVFLMERTDAGGDPRLHRKASIGVGGHLNPVDRGDDPLLAGLRREWSEEVRADWEPEFQLIGFLNDDRNAVGAVHLGVVFLVPARGAIEVREAEKLSGRMAALSDVADAWERLETWSQLVAADLLGVRASGAAQPTGQGVAGR